MLVCVEASQHALHVYIHTHRLYIHTYILTYKYMHTYTHTCMYIQTHPHPQGGVHPIHTNTLWGVGEAVVGPAELAHIYTICEMNHKC